MKLLKINGTFSVAMLIVAVAFFIASQTFVNAFGIADSDSQINSIIYNKKFSLTLTEEEKKWLETKPVIRLGIDRAFPPFGSITKEHEYVGFTADIMRLIEFRLGLQFDIAKDTPWNETLEMAKAGQLDMISALVKSEHRERFLNFTPSYINNPTIIINDGMSHGYIGSLKNLNGKTVAIEKGSYSAGVLSAEYPQIKLILVESTGEALSLVSIAKADAYVGNGVTASYLIRRLGYHNLSYSGQTEYSSSHSVGVVKPNKMLSNVINKALLSISKPEIETIANYWFGMNTHTLMSKNSAISMALGFLTLFLFLAMWVFSLRKTKSELKKSQNIIKAQAEIDSLTGLGNRRKFYGELGMLIKQSYKEQKTFSLMYLDLDLFKEVNDSFGHAVGDLLLVEVSNRLLKCTADDAFVARIGGDEFMILLPEVSENKVSNIVSCIQKSLSSIFVIQGNEINVTASIGITNYPEDSKTAEKLVINGDLAMYFAKKKGRNRYAYFNKSMQEEAYYKTNLTKDLRIAVVEKQFTLHYQPIIDLASNTINKAEALIRWNHPERGLVSPIEFIPLAEEVGLINEIGEWIFKEAIDHTSNIQQKHNDIFQITINTSPLQYRKNGMNISSWIDYSHSRGLSGENIIVEITEGILMEASDSVIKKLFQLRDLNVGVAIDDFGTGYSSLSYLKKFDIDYLKIDRAFVKNLSAESDDLILIQAIIVMAHRLGIKVVAEGIETQIQKDLLIEAGCDYGQGFYFSKPIVATEFMGLLENWDKEKVKGHSLNSQ